MSSLTRAKEILCEENLSDQELQEVLNACEELADIFLDQLLTK